MNFSYATWLTLFRIALIPVLVIVVLLPFRGTNIAAAAIFALAAATDWLDGYVARRFGQATRFGAFLDPVADKLMVCVALVLLVRADPTPLMASFAAIIIGREVTISALREWMAHVGERGHVRVAFIGKVKTTAQMTALVLLLYRQPLLGLPVYEIGLVLLGFAAVLTVWSMGVYLRAAWPSLKRPEAGPD